MNNCHKTSNRATKHVSLRRSSNDFSIIEERVVSQDTKTGILCSKERDTGGLTVLTGYIHTAINFARYDTTLENMRGRSFYKCQFQNYVILLRAWIKVNVIKLIISKTFTRNLLSIKHSEIYRVEVRYQH